MCDPNAATARCRRPIIVAIVFAAIALGVGTPGGNTASARAAFTPVTSKALGMAPQTAAPAGGTTQAAPTSGGAEDVVRSLYRQVSFDAGSKVDWTRVKALFVPEAVVVLRASRTALKVLSVDGFVEDFVTFIKQANLHDRAFEESIIAVKTLEIGDVARATVHYAARIPSDGRPAQHGIDVFLLMKRDGAWRIVSIVNEIVRPGVPVPAELQKSSGQPLP